MIPRSQVLRETGLTSARLTYLEKVGLIEPAKRELPPGRKRPDVFFTPQQVELLKKLKRLQEWFNIRALKYYIEDDLFKQRMDRFLDQQT